MLRRNLKYARHEGKSREIIEQIEKEIKEAERLGLDDLFLARAFEHPKMIVIDNNLEAKKMHWGLIPKWVKTREDAYSIWNGTVNARGESIFEKASFKDSAIHSRCIVPLNAYFEFHHKKSKTFPFLIKQKDDEMLMVAGLSSKWIVPETGKIIESFTIVTTPPTPVLAAIHNNPKRDESRMFLLLNSEDIETWLRGDDGEAKPLIKTNFDIDLISYTTKPILGKNSPGNVLEILDEHYYPELDEKNSLFD